MVGDTLRWDMGQHSPAVKEEVVLVCHPPGDNTFVFAASKPGVHILYVTGSRAISRLRIARYTPDEVYLAITEYLTAAAKPRKRKRTPKKQRPVKQRPTKQQSTTPSLPTLKM